MTQAMLSLFENQRQKPTLQSLDVLVRSLGCPISTFAIVLQEYEKLKHCRVENIEDLIPLAGLHSLRTHLVEMLWLRVRRLEERLEVLVPGSMAGTPVDLETEPGRGSELGANLASHGNGSTN